MYSFTSRRVATHSQRALPKPIVAVLPRQFHRSTPSFARKDAQGKDDIVVEPNEYSQSGSDSKAAATEDAAFSRDKTRPEEQHAQAGKEAGDKEMSNPLDVSPANQKVSQSHDSEKGGAQGSPAETGSAGSSDRARSSGGGSAPKNG